MKQKYTIHNYRQGTLPEQPCWEINPFTGASPDTKMKVTAFIENNNRKGNIHDIDEVPESIKNSKNYYEKLQKYADKQVNILPSDLLALALDKIFAFCFLWIFDFIRGLSMACELILNTLGAIGVFFAAYALLLTTGNLKTTGLFLIALPIGGIVSMFCSAIAGAGSEIILGIFFRLEKLAEKTALARKKLGAEVFDYKYWDKVLINVEGKHSPSVLPKATYVSRTDKYGNREFYEWSYPYQATFEDYDRKKISD